MPGILAATAIFALLMLGAAPVLAQSARVGLMARLSDPPEIRVVADLYSLPPAVLQPPLPEPSLKWGRFAVVTGATAGGMVGLHVWQQHNWWKDSRTRFHFKVDAERVAHLDKLGHVVASSVLANAMTGSLRWSGMSADRAALWGSIYALAYFTHVEIQDGFAGRWGFDPYDQFANVIGVSWFYGRHHIPALRHFDLKFTYFPSEFALSEAGIRKWKRRAHPVLPILNRFSDDYEGHTYWLSVRVWEILPAAARPYWPSFLTIAGGVGAENLTKKREPNYRTYYLSLDVDFSKVIPQRTRLGRSAAEVLNFFHFPAPAIRIHPSRKYYWLYYGRD